MQSFYYVHPSFLVLGSIFQELFKNTFSISSMIDLAVVPLEAVISVEVVPEAVIHVELFLKTEYMFTS